MIDLVMSAANLVLLLALAPQVVYQHRIRECTVPLSTSVPIAGALSVVTGSFFYLGLWLTGGIAGITVAVWIVIAAQRAVYGGGREKVIQAFLEVTSDDGNGWDD